jgi:CubicO group peptidase (beta-lactamase class C family)
MSRTRLVARLMALVVLLLSTSSVRAAPAPDLAGWWDGEVTLGDGLLRIGIEIEAGARGWQGRLSVPDHDVWDFPLAGVGVDGDLVTLDLAPTPTPAVVRGTLDQDGRCIVGHLSQSGQDNECSLTRSDDPAARARLALDGFERFVQDATASWLSPGLAVGVVANGEVVWAKGFGMRDAEAGLPVTSRSLFQIASCTKAFTSFAIASVVAEGKLDWDAPVVTYLPDFQLHDEYASRHVTLRDMCSHRTGAARHDMVMYNNRGLPRSELVRRMRYLEPAAELRGQWQYNNMMYVAAGYIAAQVAGCTWEKLVSERIFDPLGMTRTCLSVDDMEASDDYCRPYVEDRGEVKPIPLRGCGPDLPDGPDGAVISCVDDMNRWMLLMLGDGRHGGTELLDAAACRELRASQASFDGARDPVVGPWTYALGWRVATYHGHLRVDHSGLANGFAACVTLFPDDGIGIVTLANREAPLADIVALHASDRLLGVPGRERWAGDGMSYNEEALNRIKPGSAAGPEAGPGGAPLRVKDTQPSHALEDYAGLYRHPGYGTVTVTRTGDDLAMEYNGLHVPLEHWHYDVFRCGRSEDDPRNVMEGARVTFYTDQEGRLSRLSIPFEPAVDDVVFRRTADPRLSDPEYVARLVGTYREPDGPPLSIELRDGKPFVIMPGGDAFGLVPLPSGRFGVDGIPELNISFRQDGDAVDTLFIHQGDQTFELSRMAEEPGGSRAAAGE